MKGSRTTDGVLEWRCYHCKEWRPSTDFTTRHARCTTCKRMVHGYGVYRSAIQDEYEAGKSMKRWS